MKKILFVLFLFSGITNLTAQDYDLALGLRAGKPGGVSVKKMLGYRSAIEGIVGTIFENGVNIVGLYEFHSYLGRGSNWFVGAGGSVSVGSSVGLGVDAIIGIEYNFRNMPLNVSIDYKPMLLIIGLKPNLDQFAISIRYVLRR